MEVVPGASNNGNEEAVNKNGVCNPDDGYLVEDDGKLSDEKTTPEQPKESRAEMLSRHQRESKELQNKEVALKKAAAKGSKAEQKTKKKQVEDEIAKLDAKMKARHTKELSSLGYKSNDSKDLDNLVKAVAGVSVTSTGHLWKPTKSVKRREKIAQQEAEREQRIQEEQGNIISDRVLENERLQQKLQPLGLLLYEIKPDGHCLYRAVENQLSLYPLQCQYSYQQLREMAADYMRNHAEDFLPFFLSDSENDTELNDNMQERFEKYCREVESTAAWGGQLELGALAHSLRKHMVIFAGNFPDVEMGKEYKSENEGGLSANPSIMLSYHKHAYGLGEHYNSVVPIQGTASS
ncbi:hypothetical protein SUGI_1065480 [Cryptomeria japonica]|uniref:OVARIAN TUMOR DOMAIN-containing deubiquitinating enzyme 5 n=1 Tax=Cryptomeria japonica TaxID=3369 RepID=UPI002414A779|nr:OVARIAN TUMOR DOMAIN-containing deubiquitinating enzyme 5 [Cryptomeria japonica]GLJ50094.1 hypothetical protein SUGI_1065480 [Cryptomeria japonica]